MAECLTRLHGEIDHARRDISAWKYWLDQWAPKLRQLWLDSGKSLSELEDRVGTLEIRTASEAHALRLSDLEAHALVTMGRLESLEQALAEWNVECAPFSDRLAEIEGRLSRIEGRLPE